MEDYAIVQSMVSGKLLPLHDGTLPIDLLSEYRTEEIPDTKQPVVNPRWRDLNRQKQSIKSKLTIRRARFAALTMHPESDESVQAKWEKHKAELVEEIQQFRCKWRKSNPDEGDAASSGVEGMPEPKFRRLAPSRKQLVDTVRMIAYQAYDGISRAARQWRAG